MDRFFFIERTQTWVNLRNIVALFRNGLQWTVQLSNNLSFNLNDAEFMALLAKLNDIEDDWKEGREERKRKREHKD